RKTLAAVTATDMITTPMKTTALILALLSLALVPAVLRADTLGEIAAAAGTKEVIYGAADNKGGMTVGKWIEYNNEATLVSTHTDAEGKEQKMAVVHT